jgi:hypothetical protein
MDNEGYLRKNPTLWGSSFEKWFTDHGVFSIDPAQCKLFCDFLRQSFRLDPANRATAEDLRSDWWFEGVE